MWCTITLIRVFHHSPWYDEAHAWLIAQELNLIEIIKLMKIEGHTFIWYLCLMPFAKTNFMYPYSMLLLNWLFCFIAILILWLKAPFNNLVKFLISFSFPFLTMYPVVARCYSLGIMFLFALAAMEKVKLNHPNWYALLLILCANTSVMAAVGATVFGAIFLYDMIKNKTKFIIPVSIMLLGAVFVLYQLSGSTKDIIWGHVPMGKWFLSNVFVNNLYINITMLLLIFSFYVFFYIKNKIFPKYLVLTYLILCIVIFIYSGNIWHWFFFYIYLIISSWMILTISKEIKFKKAYVIFLCVISFMYVLYKPNHVIYNYVWHDKSKSLSKYILKNKNFVNSNI
ncbi:hypothetical protein IJ707_01990, partial [bacterium]|nr:hypothetical protein [bacterium]